MRGVFGKCASIFLVIGSFCMLNPLVVDGETVAEEQDSTLNVSLASVISLKVSTTQVDLATIPEANGAFTFGSIDATVSTNNDAGYELEFSSASDETSLIHEEYVDPDKHIRSLTDPSIVTATNQDNFAMNSWGYTNNNKLDLNTGDTTTTFHPIPEFGTPDIVAKSDSATSNAKTTITFGARVDDNMYSGTYFNVIMFTAIVNYAPSIHDFYHINYMQEMDLTVCDSVPTPSTSAHTADTDGSHIDDPHYFPETKLVDIRDNATYTIRKLADGNCWMSNNLRLGSSEEHTLTSADTDLPTGTTFTLPRAQTSEDPLVPWAANTTDSVAANKIRVYHHSQSYGNYYNWYTATATTGDYSFNADSPDAAASLCPKGWQLPSDEGNKSFRHLFNEVYGYANGTNAAAAAAVFATPFSFSAAGRYSYNGELYYVNGNGYWWTKSPRAHNAVSILYAGKFSNVFGTYEVHDKVSGASIICVNKS